MYAFFDVFTGSAFRGNSRVSVVYPNKRSETRRVDDVIADLKPHRRLEAVAACIRTYGTSRDRMRCDLCRKRGLPVGAGVVESACKQIVGSRFKGAGRRWSKAGADALLAVKCRFRNNRWPDFLDWKACSAAAA